jgi:formylglycine-generating enzyme required for sulfatase activity
LDALGEAAAFGTAAQAVAQLRDNAFGLYDVHGNVAEWCRDWKHDYANATLRARDGLLSAPTPVRIPELRSVRGGNAAQGPFGARSSARSGRIPSAKDPLLGIRPVRSLTRN